MFIGLLIGAFICAVILTKVILKKADEIDN